MTTLENDSLERKYTKLADYGFIPIGLTEWFRVVFSAHPVGTYTIPFENNETYATLELAYERANNLVKMYPNYHLVSIEYQRREDILAKVTKMVQSGGSHLEKSFTDLFC